MIKAEIVQHLPTEILPEFSEEHAHIVAKAVRQELPYILPYFDSITHLYDPEDIMVDEDPLLEGKQLTASQFFTIATSIPVTTVTFEKTSEQETVMHDIAASEVVETPEAYPAKQGVARRGLIDRENFVIQRQRIEKDYFNNKITLDEAIAAFQTLLTDTFFLSSKKTSQEYTPSIPIPSSHVFQERDIHTVQKIRRQQQEVWQGLQLAEGTTLDIPLRIAFLRSRYGAYDESKISSQDSLIQTTGTVLWNTFSRYFPHLSVEFLEADCKDEQSPIKNEEDFFNRSLRRRNGYSYEHFSTGGYALHEAYLSTDSFKRFVILFSQGKHGRDNDEDYDSFCEGLYNTISYALSYFKNCIVVDLSNTSPVVRDMQADFHNSETFLYVPMQASTAQEGIVNIIEYMYKRLPYVLSA